MRLSSLALLVGASALGAAQATGADSNTDPDKNTFFDGHKVPPLLELTPDNFAKETKASKYTVVKYYRYASLAVRQEFLPASRNRPLAFAHSSPYNS